MHGRMVMPFVCTIVCILTMRMSCMEPRPLPQRLGPPRITSLELAGHRSGGSYEEALLVQWKPPANDSGSLQAYVLLRSVVSDSSGFIRIPGTFSPRQHTYHDPLSALPYYPTAPHPYVYYKIFAIDSFDQRGDTSGVDTIGLTFPPLITHPRDTLATNHFAWRITGIQAPFRTHAILWSSDTVLWRTEPSALIYVNESDVVRDSSRIPDALWPLPEGNYYFGVNVTVPGYPPEYALNIAPLYAPGSPLPD